MKVNIPNLDQAADASIYSPFSIEKRWALLLRLAADLIELGELRPTPVELARWAAAQPCPLTADVLSSLAELRLRGGTLSALAPVPKRPQ